MRGSRGVAPTDGGPAPERRRWVVLAVGMLAMATGCAFQYGLPYLIPALRDEGLTLGQAGLLAACPVFGLVLTLAAWGSAADRWGERWVLAGGLGLAGLVLLAARQVHGTAALGACFVLAGAAGASAHASSGRLILGWFPARERGVAMGLRQTSLPLGMALAAVLLPRTAAHGRGTALAVLGAMSMAAALLVVAAVRDPARPARDAVERAGSPYRTPVLWRLHGAATLLVVPQYVVGSFALVLLVDERGWAPSTAGALLACVQVGGAGVRLASGRWSDVVGSRTGPMRVLALVTAGALAALTVSVLTRSPVATVALVAAGVLTVSTNGLSFTAVAEYAGAGWAGRALGVHTTAQNAVAACVPPVAAQLIGARGFGLAYGLTVALPLLAATLVPTALRPPDAEPVAGAGTADDTGPVTEAGPGSPGELRPARRT
ncbi:MFS transporter [Kitasatospora sp. NBC_00240]|uniref:MFS transporter n=1 Tax=Kitasatospora sp. NBC_00240 TaxID=2903567 RepID=UPI002258267C|nr:MFS transporter [Kitasatospora sp. NBC_00240]MCX5210400.1 MFS transporter [Kitasatospora sp. NBC_00240]